MWISASEPTRGNFAPVLDTAGLSWAASLLSHQWRSMSLSPLQVTFYQTTRRHHYWLWANRKSESCILSRPYFSIRTLGRARRAIVTVWGEFESSCLCLEFLLDPLNLSVQLIKHTSLIGFRRQSASILSQINRCTVDKLPFIVVLNPTHCKFLPRRGAVDFFIVVGEMLLIFTCNFCEQVNCFSSLRCRFKTIYSALQKCLNHVLSMTGHCQSSLGTPHLGSAILSITLSSRWRTPNVPHPFENNFINWICLCQYTEKESLLGLRSRVFKKTIVEVDTMVPWWSHPLKIDCHQMAMSINCQMRAICFDSKQFHLHNIWEPWSQGSSQKPLPH